MRAFIFPGQGSQRVGMAMDLYEEFPVAREIMDEADSLLGFSLTRIMFNGPDEVLKESKNTQPAILLHSYVVFNLIKDKMDFDATAGHSLGEYTALLASGAVSFPDALHLVRFRGELMSKAGKEREGAMAAIIGLDQDVVYGIVEECKDEGVIVVANYNEPRQFVVSGEPLPIRKAVKLVKARDGRGIPLKVSGAFHSPLMETATVPFSKVLTKIEFKEPHKQFYANVTGRKEKDPTRIRELLSEQITRPVRWTEIVLNMISNGVREFVELGPGNVLTKLVQRISGDVKASNISTVDDLRRFLDA